MPERSPHTVACMVGEERRVSFGRRLLSARLAVGVGIVAFVLNIGALVVVASANQTAPQLVRLMALLPTTAVGMLVAVRRPGNPLGWLLLGCGVLFSLQAASVAYSVLDYPLHHGTLPLGRLAIALQPTWAAGVGLVLLSRQVLSFKSPVAVAASTLAAAALFNPLRRRVQRIVDRRFNRAHYDGEATVAAFAGRLRGSVDLTSIREELAATVDQAFEPTQVSVWVTGRAT
jgi:hypothetical protein